MDEDIRLMLELKSGDKTAFDRLLDKYEKPIINYIYRFTGSKEDSKDLTQDTFIKVYNAAQAYNPSAKFTTWLYRIASNISIDYLRRRKSSGNPSSLDEEFDSEGGKFKEQLSDTGKINALETVEKEEKGIEIEKALQSLPENQRAAIILKIYDERPYNEIAQIIGVSLASVESLLFRARTALRAKLKNKI
jgi:RNA polymerase sigma-70 factor (ECF subfamily)